MKHPLVVFVLLVIVLTACQPIAPPVAMMDSPLARGVMMSPLPRGGIPWIDQDRSIFASQEEQRAQFVVAHADLSTLPYHVQLPIVAGGDYPCSARPIAAELLNLILKHAEQMRTSAHCSSLVTQVAQRRADDMVNRRYFSHTDLDGVTPNEWLGMYGCLPSYYPRKGNIGESIGMNYFTAQTMLEAFSRSPYHWTHLMGKHPGYVNQVEFGVGYASSQERTVMVVMSTPECS